MDCFRVYLQSYIFETKATIREWNSEIHIFHDHVRPCKHLTLGPSAFGGVGSPPSGMGGESHGSMTISDPFILDPQVIRTSWLVAASAIPDWETWRFFFGALEKNAGILQQLGFMKRGNKCNSELVFLLKKKNVMSSISLRLKGYMPPNFYSERPVEVRYL